MLLKFVPRDNLYYSSFHISYNPTYFLSYLSPHFTSVYTSKLYRLSENIEQHLSKIYDYIYQRHSALHWFMHWFTPYLLLNFVQFSFTFVILSKLLSHSFEFVYGRKQVNLWTCVFSGMSFPSICVSLDNLVFLSKMLLVLFFFPILLRMSPGGGGLHCSSHKPSDERNCVHGVWQAVIISKLDYLVIYHVAQT